MRSVKAIFLEELIPVKSWRNANYGALLQVQGRDDASPWIGFRAVNPAEPGSPEMLLRVDTWEFVDLEDVPALDVSELVDIVIDNPRLSRHSGVNATCGNAYLSIEDGSIHVWARVGRTDGYFVCIKPSEEADIGELVKTFHADIKEIGPAKLVKSNNRLLIPDES